MDIIKKNMLKYEDTLSSYAMREKDATRLKKEENDIRPAYFHDIDRIIHSLSYTRYIDKTQVFSNNENDNITKRIIHVQLVSKIARTIGRALNLNEDLIEAMSLGHDIGHIPFGHTGEAILDDISFKNTGKHFYHNLHSVRTLMLIENHGKGYNLTIQTLDGIMCHNGELTLSVYKPKKKTVDDFLNEFEKSYVDNDIAQKLRPMTLEGCVVRISDIIGYLGRDIEDAIRLNIIQKKDIPKEITAILGEDNKSIVNTIVLDIIKNSIGKDYIKLSEKVYHAIEELKKFNYKNIYYKANSKEKLEEYKYMFNYLFEIYRRQLKENDENEKIYKVFLRDMSLEYLNSTTIEEKVIDYIAGMTDDYFLNEYERLKSN